MKLIVETEQYVRVFVSEKIRTIIQHLQRYNPKAKVIGIYDDGDEFYKINQDIWIKVDDEYLDKIKRNSKIEIPEKCYTLVELFLNYSYEDANLIYLINSLNFRYYPSTNPFKHTHYDIKEEDLLLKPHHYPLFLKDEENPYNGSDVLKYYYGKRYKDLYNGIEYDGYIILGCRNTEL